LAGAFVVTKAAAVVAGPAGLAVIGNVQNIATIAQSVGSNLFVNAVLRISAENRESPALVRALVGRALFLSLFTCLFVALLLVLASKNLAAGLCGEPRLGWIFILVAISLPFCAVLSTMTVLQNGLGEIRRMTRLLIWQSLLVTGFGTVGPILFGYRGALAAAALSVGVGIFSLAPWLRNLAPGALAGWWRSAMRWTDSDRLFVRYAAMAITTAVCTPLVQIAVRWWIKEKCSFEEAGYWQASVRLSTGYMLFLLATLTTHYLPQYSRTKSESLSKVVAGAYRVVLPVVALFFMAVWVMREKLVGLLFSSEFQPVKDLVAVQLVSDFLRIGSWILAAVMTAKGIVAEFIISEIAFGLLYACLVVTLVSAGAGARMAIYASLITYALYWIWALTRFRFWLTTSQ
jgi:PST family polysaccharide transporter